MYFHQVSGVELGKFRFRPGKALKRAVTITKTSFQPKKIFGAMASITAGIITAGLGPLIAPKIFSANSKTMQTLGMVQTAIGLAAGAVVLGPVIAASLGPKLASAGTMLGKGVEMFSKFISVFNKLSPQKQEEMARQLTAEQIADIETGKAQLSGQGLSYDNQAPGSLKVQGEMVPAGYGSDLSVQPRQSAGGIDPMYIALGGGGLLLVMMMMNQNRR